jgi:hypothetical protein
MGRAIWAGVLSFGPPARKTAATEPDRKKTGSRKSA